MGISSSYIVGIFSTNNPVLYQTISILRLPLSFLPTLVRITYEGNEGGREKFEGETGEQFISILRLPLCFLPTLVRITYEGKEGGKEKFEGVTGEQRRDVEERQEPMLKKLKFYNYFLSSKTFSNFLLL